MKKRNKTSKIGKRPKIMVGLDTKSVNMLTDPMGVLGLDALHFRRFTRAVFAAHAAVLRHGDAMNARFQQSAARWRVLIRIELGDISASAIAKVTGYSRQSVHRLLTELQNEGLVQTSTDSVDQRRLRPQLTKMGRDLLTGMEVNFNVWASELVIHLQASRLDQTSGFLEEAVVLLRREEAAVKERVSTQKGPLHGRS